MTDKTKVKFISGQTDLSSYIEHSLWSLDYDQTDIQWINSSDRYFFYNNNSNPNETKYSNEDLSFKLVLKRKPLYFMMNNIFPTLILNLITLLAYGLPFATQIGLCMNILILFFIS